MLTGINRGDVLQIQNSLVFLEDDQVTEWRGFLLVCPLPSHCDRLGAVCTPTSPTRPLHRLHPPASARFSHQPLPGFLGFLRGTGCREAPSQPRPGGTGPSKPSPGPNSISKLNEFAEEPGELLFAGWVVPGQATERAAARAGRALGSIDGGGGTERVKNVRANCS